MSVPPLVDLPTSACASSVIMTLTRVVGMTVSPFTLEDQTFKWQGEAWSIDFSLPPFTSRAVASDWITFGAKMEGIYGRFLMGDPSARLPRGVASGSPQVDGNNQTGNALLVKGFTPNINGILLKGDYIQLGTGVNSRLHMVVDDVNSDVSGNAVLNIVPALRLSPTTNDPVIVSNARGIFRLVDNSFSWSVDPGPVYRVSFQAREVVNA